MAGFDTTGSTPTASIGGGSPIPSVTVSGSAPSIITVGVPVSFQFTASGGTGPYTYSVMSGAIPDGMSLDSSTGIVSGYPTAAAIYSFSIQATDSLSATGHTPGILISAQGYAAYPGKIITDSNIGPYNVDIRNPYGYGIPPGTGPVRLSWLGLEVLHPGVSFARVSWLGVEVLHVGVSFARVSWLGVEVLRTVYDKTTPRPFPPRHIWLQPEEEDWSKYLNQHRRGGAPKAKRPVLYAVV